MTTQNVLVDSSGWVEYFTGSGKKNASFETVISKNAKQSLFTSPVVIYEVFRRMKITFGEYRANKSVAYIINNCIVLDLNKEIALEAGRIGVKKNLPMADSLIYATAKLSGAKLVTSDQDFKGLEGVEII